MTDSAKAILWPEVWAKEKERIRARRTSVHITHPVVDESSTIGLALSGGGIRSATFSLGLMRAFARVRCLECFDYLSTVSGGGYAGAFFGSIFERATVARSAPFVKCKPPVPVPDPYAVLGGPICRPGKDNAAVTGWSLWWLRGSGRYLAPTGAGDYVYAVALALRNLFAVQYVLGLTLAIVAAAVFLLEMGLNTGGDRLLTLLLDSDAKANLVDAVGWAGKGFFSVAVLYFAVWLVPLGLAYFIAEMPKSARPGGVWWQGSAWRKTAGIGVVGAVLATTLSPWFSHLLFPYKLVGALHSLFNWIHLSDSALAGLAAAVGVIAVVVILALWQLGRAGRYVQAGKNTPTAGTVPSQPASPQGKMLAARVVLTKRLAFALKCVLVLLTLGALIFFSEHLVASEAKIITWISGLSGLSGTIIISLTKKLASSSALPKSSKTPWHVPLQYLALVLGMALVSILSLAWFAIVDLTAASLSGSCPDDLVLASSLAVVLVLLIPLALVTGSSFQFLNLSSIQNLYSSRLVRAYLGASNPARSKGEDTRWIRISDTHPNDDIPLARYFDPKNNAPLHVINVTLNETVSPTDPLVQRDRHGRAMAVCPGHMCVDGVWTVRVDDLEADDVRSIWRRLKSWVSSLFTKKTSSGDRTSCSGGSDAPEAMSLGSWVGISGAAAGTAMGRGTSMGKSLLLGLANVRLGYWWRSGVLVERSATKGLLDKTFSALAASFQTQAYLVAELLGRFSGRYAPYWCLSDGGGFDNTGIYELLRRKLGVIVCSDNGADPAYEWEDLANLIRLARIDFGCEFTEISEFDLIDLCALGELVAGATAIGRGTFSDNRCLRVFWVKYPVNTHPGTLLVVLKPRLLQSCPADVHQYAQRSETFPQETTGEQFFSEEQWESYRELGEIAGGHLVGSVVANAGDSAHAVCSGWLELRRKVKEIAAAKSGRGPG